MLSTSIIKNSTHASHYFSERDNYYTQNEGLEHSEWWGKGANKLSLCGKVTAAPLTALLQGKLPDGEQVGTVIDGAIKHRPGWDLTFSAPKSVSIMALVAGDQRLIEAHRQAVKVTLSYIERSHTQARIKTASGMTFQNTHNLIASLYHHDLSRAKDPQLHTHAVVMNLTERKDGQWRSLASAIGNYNQEAKGSINGFIESVRHHNRFFSKLYETELGFRIKQLGYELTIDAKTGVFQIADVPQSLIQLFSKRRLHIEHHLDDKGLSGGKAAAIATLHTRSVKEKVNREQLKTEWEQVAKDLGCDLNQVMEHAFNKKNGSNKDQEKDQDQEPGTREVHAIIQATKTLAVFQTTFSLEEVLTLASLDAIGDGLSFESLLIALHSQCEKGELITLAHPQGKTLLMAKTTLDDEKRLAAVIKENKLSKSIIENVHLVNYLAQHHEIDPHHHSALHAIFGNERMVLLEGSLQYTKDVLLEPIIKMAHAAQCDIAILSPTLINSKHLAHELKQKPHTFWEKIKSVFVDDTLKHYSVLQFLSDFDGKKQSKHKQPDILIVDHAHLLSTYQKAALAEWNSAHHSKLILLGDKKALLPQQTGSSLEQIIDYGIKTISINKQTNQASSVKERSIYEVINQYADRIVEVKETTDRHLAMAKHYKRLSIEDRKNAWLISPRKETVEQLNLLTHRELTNQHNKSQDQSIEVKVLLPQFLTEAKAMKAGTYEKNQLVRFNETFSSLSVHKGEYLRVIKHHKKTNRVMLQKENGKTLTWRPDRIAGISAKVELFVEKNREFAIGERVVFHRSHHIQGITKGERFTITAIQKSRIKLSNENKKAAARSVLIDIAKPYHRHLDYGYAATLHRIAHERPSVLIAELPAKAFTTDQRQFYQAISGPKEAWLYTDHHQGLMSQLQHHTGHRLTAEQTLKAASEMKKNLHALHHVLEQQIAGVVGDSSPKIAQRAVEAVSYAMHHLAEREAGFTHQQLMQTAMQHALGDLTADHLKKASLALEDAGILLRGRRADATLWTTADAVTMEREILALCIQDQGTFPPISSDEVVTHYCAIAHLNSEQTLAIKAITQNKNRVMAVQGHPGTGKTHMLATLADVLTAKDLMTAQGYQLLGLAPTHTAVEELRKRGINAQTLDSFIAAHQKNQTGLAQGSLDQSKLILIIDEASMVSNRKMLEGLQIAYQFKCRVIPTGDRRQISSIESGKPFSLIQDAPNIETVKLREIKRQNNPILKKAVKETMDYDFKAAFTTLKDSIIEIPNQEDKKQEHHTIENGQELRLKNRYERLSVLVKDYFSFAKSEREHIQVITPGHDDRAMVNTLIREQLKQEGSLSKGADASLPILSTVSLTQIERSHPSHFKVGEVLRFSKRQSSQIKAGTYLTISEINLNSRLIKLKRADGQEVIWQVPRFDKHCFSHIEVFKKETRDIQAGDIIRWSRSDKEQGLFSSESAKIIHIQKNQMTVALANKNQVILDAHDPKCQHWDHAYAATVYAVQGKTKDMVLAHLESYRQNLTTQAAFLVALTRSVQVFRLYTDDANKLLQTLEKNAGTKLSSLEVIGEYPNQNQKNHLKLAGLKNQASRQRQARLPPRYAEQFKGDSPKFDRYTIERIKEGLNQEAEKIASEILGTPKLKGSHFVKFGSHQGSLSVTTKGEKQGWWNDFGGEGGGRNMLSFIQKQLGLNRQEALQYAAKSLGIYSGSFNDVDRKERIKRLDIVEHKKDKHLQQEQKAKVKWARKIAAQSQPMVGTIVEHYLKEQRGISMQTYPEDIRFHPGIYSKLNGTTYPAMLVIARNERRQIQAVQATYLDPSTAAKVDVSQIKIQKQNFGIMKGATLTIKGERGGPILIAEGAETGLSLAQALPHANVKITLSKTNFMNLDLKSPAKKVVFCLDNDAKDLKSDKLIAKATKRLVQDGKQVFMMMPKALNSPKQDYNDVLKHLGTDPIKNDLKNAIAYEHFYRNADKVIAHIVSNLSPISLIKNVSGKHLSDQAINHFARQMDKAAHQHHLVQPDFKRNELIKTIEKSKENEREI